MDRGYKPKNNKNGETFTETSNGSNKFDNGTLGEFIETSTTTDQTPRKRGRPKGSRNKKETITVQKEAVKGKGYKPNKIDKEPEKVYYSEQEAKSTSDFILSTVQTVMYSLVGEVAEFNTVEKILLESSLPKYLQTVELSKLAQTSNALYPLAALVGVSLYGLRIGSAYLEQRKDKSDESTRDNQETTKEEINNNSTEPEKTTRINTTSDLWKKVSTF